MEILDISASKSLENIDRRTLGNNRRYKIKTEEELDKEGFERYKKKYGLKMRAFEKEVK